MEGGRCVFEDKTRERLKADMMADLNKTSGLSTLEGGFADQVFGPMAVELEKAYGAMNAVFMLMAVDETCGGLIDIAAGNYSMAYPGFALRNSAGQFSIFYNEQQPERECRFTLAHELGHILLGHLKREESGNDKIEAEPKHLTAHICPSGWIFPRLNKKAGRSCQLRPGGM